MMTVYFLFLCIVAFQYSSAQQCRITEARVNPNQDIGGNGGGAYSDESVSRNRKVTAVEMTCGRVLVSLQLKYGNQWGPKRGGGVSPYCEFPVTYRVRVDLACDEYIIGASATSNSYINSFQLRTNKRVLRKCGTTTGSNTFELSGRQLLYTSGRQGCYVDRLRLHWGI